MTYARSARSRSSSTSSTPRPSAEPSRRQAGRRRPPGDGTRARRAETCGSSTRHSRQTNRLRTDRHGQPARRCEGRGRQEVHRPELSPAGRTQSEGAAVKDEEAPLDTTRSGTRRRRSLRSGISRSARAPRDRRHCPAVRRVLRARDVPGRRRRDARGDPQAHVPDDGERRRDVGPSSTSRTPRGRRSPRSSEAGAVCTTSSTTSRRRRPSGFPISPTRSARSRRVTCRCGSAGSWPAKQLASMMTEGRGASNAKAKRELGWQLLYPSWREGFVNGLMYEQDRSAA